MEKPLSCHYVSMLAPSDMYNYKTCTSMINTTPKIEDVILVFLIKITIIQLFCKIKGGKFHASIINILSLIYPFERYLFLVITVKKRTHDKKNAQNILPSNPCGDLRNFWFKRFKYGNLLLKTFFSYINSWRFIENLKKILENNQIIVRFGWNFQNLFRD